ncbi:MAG: hypothetical protein ACHP93_05225 [Solirubrobacterales bacterium]
MPKTRPVHETREDILSEVATAKLMLRAVLQNGGEPNYAAEKLWRAFRAIVRALVRHLHIDPQELIHAIERERDR